MKDLKPCPFCGRNAGLSEFYHEERHSYPYYAEVICMRCQARVGSTGFSQTKEEAAEKAIKAWNRRVDDDK